MSTLTILFLSYFEEFHFYLQLSKSTLKNEELLHADAWKANDTLSWLVNSAGEEQHKNRFISTFLHTQSLEHLNTMLSDY